MAIPTILHGNGVAGAGCFLWLWFAATVKTYEEVLMVSTTTTGRRDAGTLAKAAVGLGILSIILFFGLGFAVGEPWFVLAFVVGIAAVVVGWMARTRAGTDSRRLATIGLVLGAIPVVWFIIYKIIAAIS